MNICVGFLGGIKEVETHLSHEWKVTVFETSRLYDRRVASSSDHTSKWPRLTI